MLSDAGMIASDPGQVELIDESGDVDRLHGFPTPSLPLWVRFFSRATKFHDDRRDLRFRPFESASNPTYPGRRDGPFRGPVARARIGIGRSIVGRRSRIALVPRR